MGRSLCGENTANAMLNSAIILKLKNRRRAKTNRLFEVERLPIVAAHITD